MKNVMTLAWAIFRKRYAGVKSCDTRKAFAVALRSAWMTVKFEAQQLAAVVKMERELAASKLW